MLLIFVGLWLSWRLEVVNLVQEKCERRLVAESKILLLLLLRLDSKIKHTFLLREGEALLEDGL